MGQIQLTEQHGEALCVCVCTCVCMCVHVCACVCMCVRAYTNNTGGFVRVSARDSRRLAPAALDGNICLGWPLEASRGPPEAQMDPNQWFGDVPRVMLSCLITSEHIRRFQAAPICNTQLSFMPLSVWFGP